jgi:hypothetical protein
MLWTIPDIAILGNAFGVDTRAKAITSIFPANITLLETGGYTNIGDGGSAQYKNVASNPGTPGAFQSADGRWWELASYPVNPEMLGATGSVSPDTIALGALIGSAAQIVTIPNRGYPYRINQKINVPANKVILMNGADIIWAGSTVPSGEDYVFNLGTGSKIYGSNGAVVRSLNHDPRRWAFWCQNVSDVVIEGVSTREMQHTFTRSSQTSYFDVITTGPSANVCKNINVRNVSVFYTMPVSNSTISGAIFYGYTIGGSISNVTLTNIGVGVQIFGGDANPVTGQGAIGNERKARNVMVSGVNATNALGSWIFFCMAAQCMGSNSWGSKSGDVGFDFEGCKDSSFNNCNGENCHNGVLSTYFFNENVIFKDCDAYMDDPDTQQLIINNNPSNSSDNRSITFQGGQLVNRNTTKLGTTDLGACQMLSFNSVRFYNVKLRNVTNNGVVTVVSGCSFEFSFVLGASFNAIEISGLHGTSATNTSQYIIKNNEINCMVMQPAGSRGILAVADDFNLATYMTITGNRIKGFPIDIEVNMNSANAVTCFATIVDNYLSAKNIVTNKTGPGTLTALKTPNYGLDATLF